MPRVFLNDAHVIKCAYCQSHVATTDEIVSKSFHGKRGRAFLMHSLINVSIGSSEERTLMTGLHVVADVACIVCKYSLGWYYEKAHEASQKYKVGKYVVEQLSVILTT